MADKQFKKRKNHLQKLILIATVISAPEMRYVGNESKAVTNFRVVNDDAISDDSMFLNVSVWNKLAEICNEHLKPGRTVYLEGRLRHDNGNPRTFERKDGNTGASFEMTAFEVKFLDAPKDGDEAEPATATEAKNGADAGEEDYPF